MEIGRKWLGIVLFIYFVFKKVIRCSNKCIYWVGSDKVALERTKNAKTKITYVITSYFPAHYVSSWRDARRSPTPVPRAKRRFFINYL